MIPSQGPTRVYWPPEGIPVLVIASKDLFHLSGFHKASISGFKGASAIV